MDNGTLNLLGGSALLLYSIDELSKGIQYLAGSQFRVWINRVASNRFYGFILGAFLALMLSSSGAVTVMLVSLANARLLVLEQIFAVTLGAAVGSTVIVYLFTFKISQYGLLIVALGALMLGLSSSERFSRIARSVMFLGLLFFSLTLLMEAGKELQNGELFQYLINYFKARPLVPLILSTIITALIHSSAATIAFVMSLMGSHHGNLQEALPWILGANLGTTATAFFASYRTGIVGKRVSVGYLLMKTVGVLIWFPLIPVLAEALHSVAPAVDRQIAITHSLFAISVVAMFFPAIPAVVWAVKKFIPDVEEDSPFTYQYLDMRTLQSPELALAQAQREMLRVSDLVEQMLDKCMRIFERRDQSKIEEIKAMDQIVDFLNKGIKLFLTKLSQQDMTPEQVQKEFELVVRTNDLEGIGDIIDKNIVEHVRKVIKKGYVFSDEGWNEIKTFHSMVMECLKVSTAYFHSRDRALYAKLVYTSGQIDEMLIDFSELHVQRLHQGVKQSVETTSIHLDLLGNLQRISSLAVNYTKLSGVV